MCRVSLFSLLSLGFLLQFPTLALASKPSGYSLVGVISDNNESQSIAVVSASNRQTHFLQLGDEIPGLHSFRISQIARNQVILSNGRQEMRLEHEGTAASSGTFSHAAFGGDTSAFVESSPPDWAEPYEGEMQEPIGEPIMFGDANIAEPEFQNDPEFEVNNDIGDQMGGELHHERPRQIPGLILRNRGQGARDPAYFGQD